MIHDVSESLRALIRRDVTAGSDVEVVFDAPTKDWAARRNTPTIDLYFYDIREDMRRRQAGWHEVRDNTGFVTGRAPQPRHYKCSYLITAWTQRPEDEHRLLAAVLTCFLRYDTIPADVLQASLTDLHAPVPVTIGIPPPEDRSFSDVWSALGGELKPSLDLVAILPIDLNRVRAAGPPVTATPLVKVFGGDGRADVHGADAPGTEPPWAELVAAGDEAGSSGPGGPER